MKMSLFPSAAESTKSNETKGNNQSWLENVSFGEKDATVLRKKQQENQPDVVSDYTVQPEVEEDEVSSDETSNEEPVSDVTPSTAIANRLDLNEDILAVDKSCDKNNLYFKKPYKVFIPRFYRSSTVCCGLSPYYKMTFKEDKKRKRKVAGDRYFHFNFLQDISSTDETEHKDEVERLNIRTREKPDDTIAWMELVRLQEKIGGKNIRITTEKKIAILDKAISVNPREVNLKLSRLQEYDRIGQDSDREWKDLVFQHPGDRKAWEAYIQHVKQQPSATITKTLKVFERCIQTMSAIHDGSFQPKEPCPDVEKDLLVILGQVVQFLSESGHAEICLTLLTVMVEVNVRTFRCSSVSDVKDFYESGDPLLGESKSAGWETWSQKNTRGGWVKVEEPDRGTDDDIDDDDLDVDFDKTLEQNWLTMEEKRSLRDVFRTTEESEDPARKVSFDDIQGYIFFVKENSSRMQILKLLISCLGIRLGNDHKFNYISHLCHLTHATSAHSMPGEMSQLVTSCDPSSCPVGLLPREPHHKFVLCVFEQLHKSCPKEIAKQIAAVYLDYLNAHLKGLRTNKNQRQQLKHSHKEAKKIARSLLQSDPMNFDLWTRFAQTEFIAGKQEDCQKIYFNALCMCSSQNDALSLCGSYTRLVCNKQRDVLKLVLGAMGDNQAFKEYLQAKKPLTSAAVLRASRNLERICEELACLYREIDDSPNQGISPFANAVCCFGMYTYLTTNVSVPQVLQPYVTALRNEHKTGNRQAARDLFEVHSLILKLVDQDYSHHNHYRNAILSALDDFPDNPVFTVQLCKIEIGASVSSIARRLFGSLDTPLKSIFAVYFEMMRNSHSSGEESTISPRIQNLLERAVTVHNSNILLWRLYAFCAKDHSSVLIRATSNCSWSKAIACDRIRSSGESIDEVAKFMKQKGMRVRTPIEEVKLLLTM